MNENKLLKIGFWISFSVMCASLIGLGFQYVAEDSVDFSYENDLYRDRLDSMSLVAEDIFPVKNQTVVITKEGYVSSSYDWENNTKVSDGGWIIKVNNSEIGVSRYLFDGWKLEKWG